LKLYKDDHGAYPEALYGFRAPATNGGVPLEVTFLYPQYVKEKAIFHCPLAPYHTTDTGLVQAIHPMKPFNGDDFKRFPIRTYPVWDSYDGQFEGPQSQNYVVKYLTHWSGTKRGFGDNPRQLLYKNPPDDTIVTWCTYHRDYDSRASAQAIPQTGSIDLVLFLDGHVKPTPSNLMSPIQTVSVNPPHSFLVGRGD
jgi:hypothetical protein